MKRLVKYKNTLFTENSPVICSPIIGTSLAELKNEIEIILKNPVDIIEWRADFFDGDIAQTASQIIKLCGDLPVILTYRTKAEGGNGDNQKYEILLQNFVNIKDLALLDIELSLGFEKVENFVKTAKEKGIITIVSSHYFSHTPENIEEIYCKMQETGADIPKLAVMPESLVDVLKMMEACQKVSLQNSPIIGISMSKLGIATRLCPSQMGSCLSFASGVSASAPGQIDANIIKKVLDC